MLLDVPENPAALGAMTIPLGVGTAVDGPGFRRLPALRAHATACEKALRRAVPWLGRMIADGGHLNAVAPNDAVGALAQAEAAIGLRLNESSSAKARP